MRALTVFLTTAALYSAYYLACLLLLPSNNGGIKVIAGIFLLAMALFAFPERKVQAKHAALSVIIAVAIGISVPLLYLVIMLSSQGSLELTVFDVPLLFFAPIALPMGCLVFILLGAQSKKKCEDSKEN